MPIFDVRAKKINPTSEGIVLPVLEQARNDWEKPLNPANSLILQHNQPENCPTIQSTTRRVAGSLFKCG
jgi:hypothetical protein